MKLNKTILAGIAVVLPLCTGIGSALSYFTANTTASGGYAVEVGEPDTDITEGFGDWTKQVTIKNTGKVPVYVRVRAFSGSQYPLSYNGSGWIKNGDYYDYETVLGVGDTTSQLDIKIEGASQDATDKDAFNVVVIYERTPAVQYNEDGSIKLDNNGNPIPDWDYKVTEQSEFPVKPEPETPGEDENTGSGEDDNPQTPVEQPEGGDKS